MLLFISYYYKSKSLNRFLSCLFGLLLLFVLLLVLLLLLLDGVGEFLLDLLETVHGDLGSGGDAGGELVGTSCEGGLAALAVPDAGSYSADALLNDGRVTLPQGGQTYLARCWSSNFLTIFLMAPP